ncbi:MAG: aldose 1-epimerase [Candidatus Glassbacteria bacterium]|nr:aldose 1-epimerase [Candidatus Glassbacteria bacterium]
MTRPLFSAVVRTDPETGQPVIVLERKGDSPLAARVAPQSGANLFSLQFEGRELLYVPQSLDKLPGFRYGTPVLYPAPNRVAGGRFSFEGRTFDFGLNDGDRFLHGLVHSVPWEYEPPVVDENGASVLVYLDFKPGGELHRLFGFDHRLSIRFTVDGLGVRFDYTVDNRDSLTLPYGFALHPYFVYLGSREQAYLTVPAAGHMEAVNLMPTGKVEPLEGGVYDLTGGKPLSELDLDDVYLGMKPEKPALIEYRDAGLKITLEASADFTHMVVYTQQPSFFCVENQTCSTDAHNLYALGLQEAAHLLTVPPGSQRTGWIMFEPALLAK